jgi:hypothetical protein
MIWAVISGKARIVELYKLFSELYLALVYLTLIALSIFSQLPRLLGQTFSIIDNLFNRVARYFIPEELKDEFIDIYYEYVMRRVDENELHETAKSEIDSRRVYIQTMEEEQQKGLTNYSTGEFVLGLLIIISSLSLSFFPELGRIQLRSQIPIESASSISILTFSQWLLALLTIILVVSVIVRTKFVQHLLIDDISVFDSRVDILLAKGYNEFMIQNPLMIILLSIVDMEVLAFYRDSDYGVPDNFGGTERTFYIIAKKIEENRPDS